MVRLQPSFRARFLFLAMTCASAHAGTISGTVHARPPEAAAASGESGGNYASRRYKFLDKIDYDKMHDFVVSIDQVQLPNCPPTPGAIVRQRDGEFEPHVLPIVMGTEVEWSNTDDIFHNVFSMSDACGFDLGLYKKGDGNRQVKFGLPGRVDVFCSIHTKMNCVVLVLPNPWFCLSDARGHYVIPNIPAGTYRLKAWHERLPVQVKTVEVPADGEVNVDFILGLGRKS